MSVNWRLSPGQDASTFFFRRSIIARTAASAVASGCRTSDALGFGTDLTGRRALGVGRLERV
jgi:hypothetical protein